MKLNNDDVKLYGKVSKPLAEKLQPLVVDAVKSSGIDRNLIQSALLKQLENTPTRIGVATAQRLLKDPVKLVQDYKFENARIASVKQQNFDANLNKMTQRITKVHPTETFQELKQKFPENRNYQQLQQAADLHVQNGGRPLTLVALPKLDASKLPKELQTRVVSNTLVLKDGESVLLHDDMPVKVVDSKDATVEAGMKVVSAPAKPQMELTF